MLRNLNYTLRILALVSLLIVSCESKAVIRPNEPFQYEQYTDNIVSELIYIGQIKGKSYIKLNLNPVVTSAVPDSRDDFSILRYKGSYFESVSGKKYHLTGDFDPEQRIWTFRCFNRHNQPVFFFTGKQKPDGSITGTWKSKRSSYPFYLRPS